MNSIGASFEPDASGQTPKQMDTIPFLTLNDGFKIPMLGFGLGTDRKPQRGSSKYDQKLIDYIKLAMEVGYRLIDCAEDYGNEVELGRAIKDGKMPRDRLFIITQHSGHADKPVQESLDQSLKKLQVDYVDLYLIHCPFHASNEELQNMWSEMEMLKESGKTRSIGVANFDQEHLEAILEKAKVPPAANQIEFHPYFQQPELIDFHRSNKIATLAYGPLTGVARKIEEPLQKHWATLGHKYGVSGAEIAIRWCIDQGMVTLTTSGKEERLQAFMSKIPVFKLTPKEVEGIGETGKQTPTFRAYWTDKIAEKTGHET